LKVAWENRFSHWNNHKTLASRVRSKINRRCPRKEKAMEVLWMTLLPRQGTYCHIRDIMKVGEIYQLLLDRQRTHYVRAITIVGEEMRMWTPHTPEDALVLHHYLLANVGVGDPRIRIQTSEKFSRSRMLGHLRY
jgi:hypothetical protein